MGITDATQGVCQRMSAEDWRVGRVVEMTLNNNQSATNPRREAREKRVQTVLKFLKKLGLPVSGGGVTGTIMGALKNSC